MSEGSSSSMGMGVLVVIVLAILFYPASWLLSGTNQKYAGEAATGVGAAVAPFSPPAGAAIGASGTAAAITGEIREKADEKQKAKPQHAKPEQEFVDWHEN